MYRIHTRHKFPGRGVLARWAFQEIEDLWPRLKPFIFIKDFQINDNEFHFVKKSQTEEDTLNLQNQC